MSSRKTTVSIQFKMDELPPIIQELMANPLVSRKAVFMALLKDEALMSQALEKFSKGLVGGQPAPRPRQAAPKEARKEAAPARPDADRAQPPGPAPKEAREPAREPLRGPNGYNRPEAGYRPPPVLSMPDPE